MADKEQIIIDGVDVSRCEFFEAKAQVMQCHRGALTQRCKANNCHYKQLARKTQEYNDLLDQHKKLDDRVNRMIEEKYNLGRECEELKSELHLYKTWYRAKHSDVKNTLGRYRKALDEIEKVCLEDTRTFADGTQIRYDSLDDILDIINKADFGKSERSETRPGESCVEPVEPPIIQEAKGNN